MSLCIANGHTEAFLYPLGMVSDEANFIRERTNSLLITETQLRQMAVASLFSEKSRKQFAKIVKSLNIETKPIAARFE